MKVIDLHRSEQRGGGDDESTQQKRKRKQKVLGGSACGTTFGLRRKDDSNCAVKSERRVDSETNSMSRSEFILVKSRSARQRQRDAMQGRKRAKQ